MYTWQEEQTDGWRNGAQCSDDCSAWTGPVKAQVASAPRVIRGRRRGLPATAARMHQWDNNDLGPEGGAGRGPPRACVVVLAAGPSIGQAPCKIVERMLPSTGIEHVAQSVEPRVPLSRRIARRNALWPSDAGT
ncbi:hypothetical protein G6O67_001133 [Ophiocordyceps sinensis]|uniref:Uncharacterized protein n=1 Tax=Ophiocordyceps sinensis TaxID=72228 RepID=A0A8H4PX05_9HYPO|nr:hypothetical protein G6O67_001133 [Ophiocordyceps sinensis]